MMVAGYLSLLLTAQPGWGLETQALLEPQWRVVDAAPISGTTLGVLGERDGGFALFAVEPGKVPTQLQALEAEASLVHNGGTGFVVAVQSPDGGSVLFNVSPKRVVTELGQFNEIPTVSCAENISTCAWTTSTSAVVVRVGATQSQIEVRVPEVRLKSDDDLPTERGEENAPLQTYPPSGLAVSPDGARLAAMVGSSTLVLNLRGPGVLAVGARATVSGKSLAAIELQLARNKSLAHHLLESYDCAAYPRRWQSGQKLEVVLAGGGDVGSGPCPVVPGEFVLDVIKATRTALPAYPWTVLSCPEGGWETSNIGKVTVRCSQQSARPQAPGRPSAPALPDALALSPTEFFVLADSRPTEYRWTLTARSKPRIFEVAGPSVITLTARGPRLDPIDWPLGKGEFLDGLEDDWHLFSHAGGLTLVRFVPPD